MNDLVKFLRAQLDLEAMHAEKDMHIARFRPDTIRERARRRLADVEAKRHIIDMYEDACRREQDPPDHDARTLAKMQRHVLETVLRLHAAAWSDHPDYRQEWRL